VPIGGATALEEGANGFELVDFNVSVGTRSSEGSGGGPIGTHVPAAALYLQYRPHGGLAGQASEEGSAKASDAIPKRRNKESRKTTILFFSS
jgi:hypothetical protein